MMNNTRTRVVFVLTLIPAAFCSGSLARGEQPKEAFNPRAEVHEFVNMIDFEKMFVYTQHWSKDLPPEQRKQILLELLPRLRNTREGRIENYADMSVTSRVQAGKMKFPGHGYMLDQDIFLENGRCAWAIEEILGCHLPAFTAEAAHDSKKLDEIVPQSFLTVVEAMDMPEKPKPETKPGNPKDESGTYKTSPMPLTGQETPRSKNEARKQAFRRNDEPGKEAPLSKTDEPLPVPQNGQGSPRPEDKAKKKSSRPKDKAGKQTPFSKDEP